MQMIDAFVSSIYIRPWRRRSSFVYSVYARVLALRRDHSDARRSNVRYRACILVSTIPSLSIYIHFQVARHTQPARESNYSTIKFSFLELDIRIFSFFFIVQVIFNFFFQLYNYIYRSKVFYTLLHVYMYIQMYNFLVKCRAFQFSQCLSQSVSYRRKTLHSPICVLTINFPFHFRRVICIAKKNCYLMEMKKFDYDRFIN